VPLVITPAKPVPARPLMPVPAVANSHTCTEASVRLHVQQDSSSKIRFVLNVLHFALYARMKAQADVLTAIQTITSSRVLASLPAQPDRTQTLLIMCVLPVISPARPALVQQCQIALPAALHDSSTTSLA